MVAHHRCDLKIHLDRPSKILQKKRWKTTMKNKHWKNDNMAIATSKIPSGKLTHLWKNLAYQQYINSNWRTHNFYGHYVNHYQRKKHLPRPRTWADIAPAIWSSSSNSATRAEADSCSADCLNSHVRHVYVNSTPLRMILMALFQRAGKKLWDLSGTGATSLYDPSGLMPKCVGTCWQRTRKVQ